MSTKRTWLSVAVTMVALIGVGLVIRSTNIAQALPLALTANPVGMTIPYSGRLANAAGQPTADGNYDFAFALYDAETGGALLWAETQRGVRVTGGNFAAPLGSVSPIPPAALSRSQHWLAVSVRGPGESEFTALTPRQRLSEVAPAPARPAVGPSCPHDHWGEHWTGTDIGLSARSTGATGFVGAGLVGVGSTSMIINPMPLGMFGVYGEGDDVGVSGHANGANTIGVSGYNDGSGYGVKGESATGHGVYGEAHSASVYGVYGYNASGYGVYGKSGALDMAGVYGKHTGTGAGVQGDTANGSGVYGSAGTASGVGVFGYNINGRAIEGSGGGGGTNLAALRVDNWNASTGMAAYLTNSSTYGNTHMNNTGSGEVLVLQSNGGRFIRAVNQSWDARFRLEGNGNGYADGGWYGGGADLAEMLPAVEGVQAGDVLVIGPDGKLTRSTGPYQTSVAGVYSTKPGFVGGHPIESAIAGTIPLAIVGVAPVKASAENGAIRPGDLLVASATPGHAMKAGLNPPQGAVIGKALEKLDAGVGVIKILVTLQ